ncbi:hypothetical protein PQR70_43025 [Paraburkholderia madseniana]|uniref:hypothetical protein n=1 Tax=Paraburkholderia madseniana TaxID=2599607 RepID=UPI0038BD9411
MADAFELVALGLPADLAPDALSDAVKRLVAECWPGTSRAQLVARARRRALQPSLRAHGATAPGDTGLFSLTLLAEGVAVRLIAHLRRGKPRRQSARPVKASKPPARDPRQGDLF